ncbi:MAG TPA: bifunctional hydroxymethylpyrimidine kinase/phosphomethylpyrimidine kinase [Pyrinomonadaceae bacterium]
MTNPKTFPERALTIAGFDPSGGAGVLADVRTFASFGFQAVAAVTSVTFQNTMAVLGATHQTGEAVRAQVMSLMDDFRIVCLKIGMLPTREVVLEVARLSRETDLPQPVVDPVIQSSSGYPLMDERALDALIKELLPMTRVLTPNIPEAEALTGITITSETDMRQAAAIIRGMGARAVLIKGGHLGRQEADGSRQTAGESTEPRSEEAIDVLDDDGKVTVFSERRILGAELHGSGCLLSSAVAAGLGKGMTLEDSVGAAKSFVLEALRDSTRQG